MKKFAFAVLALAAVAVASAELNVTGAWKGRMIFDKRLETSAKTKEQKAAVKKVLEDGSKVTVSLTLNKNKTFTAIVNFPDKTKQVSSGTWSLKGDEVITRTTQREGKAIPTKEQKNQVMKVDKSGKQMVRFFEEQPGMGVLFLR
ncbi:MAG: copper resistance protein NlpE N-terminal domain-containing protein [Chthonomonas sp.]|nr:copper resistance protein NlpE N-terminal domain-containing protein [Chthonomonas sp.]